VDVNQIEGKETTLDWTDTQYSQQLLQKDMTIERTYQAGQVNVTL